MIELILSILLLQTSPDTIRLEVYRNDGVWPAPYQETLSFTCGQPKQAFTKEVNPTRVIIDDPNDISKDCIATPEVLKTLPINNYWGSAVRIDSEGHRGISQPFGEPKFCAGFEQWIADAANNCDEAWLIAYWYYCTVLGLC